MTSYPLINDYQEAVQHPKTAFIDKELQQGKVSLNGLGLPSVISGGFALTYSIKATDRHYAVRCFHKQIPSIERTYDLISKTLQSLNSDYFVKFRLMNPGVRVGGKTYPIVCMDWVKGKTLGTYLEDEYSNKQKIEQLRQKFRNLSAFIETAGIGHGDLQELNVIITPQEQLKLIDYDGMYVPGMTGKGTEEGQKNFQHPERKVDKFGPKIDRFSFIVIDLSLSALIEDNRLFKKYNNGQNIILTANDFADPQNSVAIHDIFKLSGLKEHASDFIKICAAPFDSIPSLNDFLLRKNIPSVQISIKPKAIEEKSSSSNVKKAYIPAFTVIAGTDYNLANQNVGARVELIGKIVEVQSGKTRTRSHKPYVFLKFEQGKNKILKINIWSEALVTFKETPSNKLIGKWVSVTGLLESYTGSSGSYRRNASYGPKYTNLQITISSENELHWIDEKEAHYRLGIDKGKSTSSATSKNQQILQNLKKPETSLNIFTGSTSAWSSKSSNRTLTRNQQLLSNIPGSQPSISRVATSTAVNTSKPSSTPVTSKKKHYWVWWVVAAIIAMSLFNNKEPKRAYNTQSYTPPKQTVYPLVAEPTQQLQPIEPTQPTIAVTEIDSQAEAFLSLRFEAEAGNDEAQVKLGLAYSNGDYIPKEETQAINWFRKAADQGNSDAQFYLGEAYLFGKGIPINYNEAIKWYRAASNQGNVQAQIFFASAYDNGLYGFPRNKIESEKWWSKAFAKEDIIDLTMLANKGYSSAQYRLGQMYDSGEGVLQNEAEAVKWYKVAAENGSVFAQAEIGLSYQQGKGGLIKNDSEAVRWSRKAADQGYDKAQGFMAGAYYNGIGGLIKDYSEAQKWAEKAADQGYDKAQNFIGGMYYDGILGEADYVKAHMWFSLAADQDNGEAKKNLRMIEESMTEEELATSQRLLKVWKALHKRE